MEGSCKAKRENKRCESKCGTVFVTVLGGPLLRGESRGRNLDIQHMGKQGIYTLNLTNKRLVYKQTEDGIILTEISRDLDTP